ncbi:unnamed protein product [Schistocephalus solidus]|uniref:Reverse transcriptase domain-containing protein n=1 Tax=Schistocephalus solidus TaxID=70667 RepID=A0A183SW30_SCHSO|nr:unnamed protein product [Schistocephalus solidus]
MALVARELVRYKVDITALIEARFYEQGQLKQTSSPPSERLRSPTTSSDVAKYKFYEDLHALLATLSKADTYLLLCEFNARIGTDHTAWHRVLGQHNLGGCNNNGLLLLRTCVEHCRLLNNNAFHLPTREKAIWRHPWSGKAPGSDAISLEVYKLGGPWIMVELATLFQEMWRQGQVLQDFKDVNIVHLYKRKGTGGGYAKEYGPSHRRLRQFWINNQYSQTVVIHQPTPSAEKNALQINVNGDQLKNVETFANMGSMLSRNTRIHDEVAQRISKASQAFDRLQASMWNHHGIHLNTKLKMYKAVVLKTLLYGAETWTVYSSQARKLNHLQLSCLRRILNLRGQYRITDTEVLEQTGILSLHDMLRRVQLRWSGHLVRMDDE